MRSAIACIVLPQVESRPIVAERERIVAAGRAVVEGGFHRFYRVAKKIEDDFRKFASSLHRRQALPDAAAVGLGYQSRVADHQHALIGFVADQAAGALLDVDHGARQLVFHEGVAAFALHALDARRQHRVVRRREGSLVDDDQRQRLAAHVDALPEALAADQDGRIAEVAEALQQVVLAALALQQQRHSRARRPPASPAAVRACGAWRAGWCTGRRHGRPLAFSTGKAASTTASVKPGLFGSGKPSGT
jgi:hypothetical protein